MADEGASDSEGSNISGVDEYIMDDFEGEMAGELADPLDRAQPRWVSNLFGESDESGEEFKGFHHDWVTDPRRFRPVNIPDCALDGAYEHPKETITACQHTWKWQPPAIQEATKDISFFHLMGSTALILHF